MTDSIVHHHHYARARDCSRGHSWRIRFKSKGDVLGWVKVCRRCDKVVSKGGSFNANGDWVEYDQASEARQGEASKGPASDGLAG